MKKKHCITFPINVEQGHVEKTLYITPLNAISLPPISSGILGNIDHAIECQWLTKLQFNGQFIDLSDKGPVVEERLPRMLQFTF
jgi:hypothetical protein